VVGTNVLTTFLSFIIFQVQENIMKVSQDLIQELKDIVALPLVERTKAWGDLLERAPEGLSSAYDALTSEEQWEIVKAARVIVGVTPEQVLRKKQDADRAQAILAAEQILSTLSEALRLYKAAV
jgi:hypothetical protein